MNDETHKDERRADGVETPGPSVPEGEKVFILIDGQKCGPFSKEKITEMVSTRDVLITDQISIDGSEWFHLFQWKEFDRRASHSEDLPGLPQVNLFASSDKEADETLIKGTEEMVERDAMAGLAYLGNLNSGKKAQYHTDKIVDEKKDEVKDTSLTQSDLSSVSDLIIEKKKRNKETYVWGAVLSFALIGISWLFLAPSPNKVATRKVSSETINKAETVSAKLPSKRLPKKPEAKASTRKVVKARQKSPSFTKSKAFNNRAPRRQPSSRRKNIEKPIVEDPDDYYYDDGTDPVELDPVRSKLAKETFDPDSEEVDEYLDQVDPEREPASAEGEEEDPEKAFEALYE